MAAKYKVQTIPAGCCGNVSPKQIEQRCNSAGDSGYELVVAYEAVVGGCPCCQSKAAVLVFRSEQKG